MQISSALTGIRFFLIFFIVNGHFSQTGTGVEPVLRFLKQHNLIVGCFFILSGYILSLVGAQKSPEDTPSTIDFFKKRMIRVYPLYLFITVLFAPMFIYVELYYGQDFLSILGHSALVLTMTQGFNPEYGTLWNSPTWFLSSMVFSWLMFPVTFRFIREKNSGQLTVFLSLAFAVLLLIRVVYSGLTSWDYAEGFLKEHTLPWFNFFRFLPFFNFPEFFTGMVAGCLYLRWQERINNLPLWSDTLLTGALFILLVVRVWFPVNDLFMRTAVMTPLFIPLLWTLTTGKGRVGRFLSRSFVVRLGDWSFAIYILHGALGQLFYKKAVRVWHGGPDVPYPIFLVLLLLLSALLHIWVEKPGRRLGSRLLQKAPHQNS